MCVRKYGPIRTQPPNSPLLVSLCFSSRSLVVNVCRLLVIVSGVFSGVTAKYYYC